MSLEIISTFTDILVMGATAFYLLRICVGEKIERLAGFESGLGTVKRSLMNQRIAQR